MDHKFGICAGAYYIPKRNPKRPLGEDAHFFNEVAQVIGVADGVGGWSEQGIDSGEYARQLMGKAGDIVEGCHPTEVDPMSVLVNAYESTEVGGSSTACIVSVCGSILRSVNLGDSGFLVIRKGMCVYKSQAQQHTHNCPYQLMNASGRDDPRDGMEKEVVLEEGDVIAVGTDGLWDNLFVKDIEKLVRFCLASGDKPKTMATVIATVARVKSSKKEGRSPFQMAAMEAGIHRPGGKADDITVVVAYVKSNNRDNNHIKTQNKRSTSCLSSFFVTSRVNMRFLSHIRRLMD